MISSPAVLSAPPAVSTPTPAAVPMVNAFALSVRRTPPLAPKRTMFPAGMLTVLAFIVSFMPKVLTVVVPAPTAELPVDPLSIRTLLVAPLAMVGLAPDKMVHPL